MGKDKIFTVSIIGCGARGGEAYGRYINNLKDKFKITHLCDINEVRLSKYGEAYDVPEANRYIDEDEFFKEKHSDLLVVSTLDRMHVRMAKRGLELGYDLLLEKPVSDDLSELKELLDLTCKTGQKVLVCHVLRYTVMVGKIKEVLDAGGIGRLISLDHTENVVFWHEAHSYVRGNWRKSSETTPMIMAKCCHDLDLIQYFVGSKCKSVSSIGDLSFFKKENQPEGAADRCMECRYVDTCKYSAKKIYLETWKRLGCPENKVPMNIITDKLPLSEENILEAITTGPYGKCAFCCDNDVVDNQTTILQFENGVTATSKMEAFVKYGGRDMRFFGTEGELEVNEAENKIVLKRYFEDDVEWKISDLTDEYGGQGEGEHGGGDHRMIDKLYDMLSGSVDTDTSLKESIESHYIAIAAEESRLKGGQLVTLSKYRK